MRRLLIILNLLLVLFVVGCSGNINTPETTQTPIVVTEKPANETTPLPTETEKIVYQQKETKKAVTEEKEPAKADPTEVPVNPEKESTNKCTLSVNCITALKNITKLDKEKAAILPPDGIILPETEATFYDGESAFNILTRELKKNKIHIDFVSSPMYNTVYIKGISNLYEKDCGELSGWLYKVNGQVPGVGCSLYILKDGDKIEFVYTCDMGKDIAS